MNLVQAAYAPDNADEIDTGIENGRMPHSRALNIEKPEVHFPIIQIYSGITSGRVLDGEFFTPRF